MKRMMIAVFAVCFITSLTAQDCYPITQDQVERLQADVMFLSDDALEGRYPGTDGADVARDYISRNFQQAGLLPMGDADYFQRMEVPEPAKINAKKTYFVYKNDTLTLGTDFVATPYSANSSVTGKTAWVNYGITAPDKEYDDYKKVKSLEGMIAVMDISSPDGIHPHSEYAKYHSLGTRIANAKEKGAIAVILVNLGDMASDVKTGYKSIKSQGIPVVFLANDDIAKKIKKNKEVMFAVQQKEKTAEAFNVIGYLDNGKATTVVIGAHYDHLGWGGKGTGSLHSGEPAIHNGADDNASGTAGLMEMARFLGMKEDLTGHNYLFIAFTAEEMGLLGSNYFVNNPTFPIESMAYMINMDMIGRLDEGQLQISGVGTATEFKSNMAELNCENMLLKLDMSGVGPSDHTSFYNMNMPVLAFFTGTHEDYHKPADDADKINYKGMAQVLSVVKTAMKLVDELEKLDFTPTKNDNTRKAPKFSVTLGIMPNYMYSDGGVKLDGVTEGKPAQVAGLQKGDIVVALGDFEITDMYDYMNALAAHKKGDKVRIVYMRGKERIETKVQF